MDASMFTFGQPVRITASGQTGIAVGFNQLMCGEPSWLVRYKNAAGDAVEQWWAQSALEQAPSGTG